MGNVLTMKTETSRYELINITHEQEIGDGCFFKKTK
jgi:hypothetical protein